MTTETKSTQTERISTAVASLRLRRSSSLRFAQLAAGAADNRFTQPEG